MKGCVALSVLVALTACQDPEPTPPDRGLPVRFIAIDVGQGDASLIIGTDGTVILIDGGGIGHGSDVAAAVQAQAGGRVDHVIVTHYDADHLGGIAEFLLGADGRENTADDGAAGASLFDYGDDTGCTSQTCDRYRRARAGRGVVMQVGDIIALGEAEAECVAVNGRVAGGTTVTPSDENSRSVALLVRHGSFRGLFAGDLTGGGLTTADVESAVARHVGELDLLHVDHHGSKTSSNATALGLWSARAGIISVGDDNSYCHPADDVLERLAGSGMALFATGSGMVHADSRCTVTQWPTDARYGLGTIEASAYRDGTLYVGGEQIP